MKKAIDELTEDQRKEISSLKKLPEDSIDTTEIPETLDWSKAIRGAFYQPHKQQITLYLDADIIAWFKNHTQGENGYQTEINTALRSHVQHSRE